MKLLDLLLPLLIEIFAFAEHWVEKPYLNRNATGSGGHFYLQR
eukprot:gene3808-4066_t